MAVVGISDLAFVVAAYGAILTAVAVYAVTLPRRIRRARAELEDVGRTPKDGPPPAEQAG